MAVKIFYYGEVGGGRRKREEGRGQQREELL